MNKQFVKENKGLVKEFLGNLLYQNNQTVKSIREFNKKIENDPKFQQHKKKYQKT